MKRTLVLVGMLAVAAGCRNRQVAPVEQPIVLQATFDEVYKATMETLKDHFEIYTAYERGGDILTQFQITYGQFEFWRDNSATRRDLWENTVQTIRRRAHAQVARGAGGAVLLTLTVDKERRDRAREGARFSFSQSASIFNPSVNALDRGLRDPTSPEWQTLGRDEHFEAYLVEEVRKRLGLV